jgi:hypothetical protein
MPTMNPRIQVTVKPSQYQLLKRLAKLQGRSMSQVLAELFDQIEPVYERVAVVLQAAVRAQDSMKQGLRNATEEAEAEMRPHVARAMGQLDLLVERSEGWQSGLAGSEPASVRDPLRTPEPVTRGSGLHTTREKSGSQRAGATDGSSRKLQKLQALARRLARGPRGKTKLSTLKGRR